MMRAKFEADGFHGFTDDVLEQLRPRAEAASTWGAERLKAAAVRRLSRTGPPVRGGPPAWRTGALAGALQVLPPRWKNPYVVDCYVEIPPAQTKPAKGEDADPGASAGRLEYGGSDSRGRYLPPFPYMRPSAEEVQPELQAHLQEELG